MMSGIETYEVDVVYLVRKTISVTLPVGLSESERKQHINDKSCDTAMTQDSNYVSGSFVVLDWSKDDH